MKYFLSVISFALISSVIFSQSNPAETILDDSKMSHSEKAEKLFRLSLDYEGINVDSSVLFCQLSKSFAKQAKDTSILIKTHRQLSFLYYWGYSDYFKTRMELDTLISDYSKNMSNTDWASYYSRLGDVVYYDDEKVKSIELYQKALESNSWDSILLARIHHNLGWTYSDLGFHDKAVKYGNKGVAILKSIGHDPSANLQGMVYIYQVAEMYDEALEKLKEAKPYNEKDGTLSYYYFREASLLKKKGDYSLALESAKKGYEIAQQGGKQKYELYNIELIYQTLHLQNVYPEALNTFKTFEKLAVEMDNLPYLIKSYNYVGEHYLEQFKLDSALFYLQKAEKTQKDFNQIDLEKTYKLISDCYEKNGETDKALYYLNKHIDILDSLKTVNDLKAAKAIDDQIRMYELENVVSTKNKEIEAKENKILLEQEQKASLAKERKYLLIALVLVVLILGYIYKTLIDRKKMNKLLVSKNEVIEKQHLEVQEKNKEITDSINYALRIQKAILPSSKIVKEYLADSFILYKPKDIVAGDFYWMESVGNKILFAAADCTGHGVPGAMVSVVCHNALNRSVREFGLTQPAQILDKTREIVIQEFEKSEEEVKDGMDIALCCLDAKTNILEFAGANNPLYHIKTDLEGDKNHFISEIKGDKQPIGKYSHKQSFTNHQIKLQKKESIIIFTDGYADQFGGDKGKKLKYKPFKQKLIEITESPMQTQKEILDEVFEQWKGDFEQVDDVCIIGLRI